MSILGTLVKPALSKVGEKVAEGVAPGGAGEVPGSSGKSRLLAAYLDQSSAQARLESVQRASNNPDTLMYVVTGVGAAAVAWCAVMYFKNGGR